MSVTSSTSSAETFPLEKGKAQRSFLFTSVGKKVVMGISGLVWAGFVFAHMAGNMLIFVSKDAYNMYGHTVTSGALLYVAETVLVLALLFHVFFAIMLTIENRRARGAGYYASSKGSKAPAFGSKTMIVQGSIILVFIIMHLATFKYGTYYETTVKGIVVRDLYRLIVEVFHQPGYVLWYLVALAFLGVHLKHGVGSTIQSLGIKNQRIEPWINRASILYAVVVAAGFMSQPVYVLFFAE